MLRKVQIMAPLTMCSPDALCAWMDGYDNVHIDFGTGDGAYSLYLARKDPHMAVIGIDTCLANLRKAAHRGLVNLRFVACDATAAPKWLWGTATSISINFPFGSLLRVLAEGDPTAQRQVFAIAKPGARVEIRVNSSAVKELALPTDVVRDRLLRLMRTIAARPARVVVEPHEGYRRFPSEWAKRLAYGHPSEIVVMTAKCAVSATTKPVG